MHHARIITEYAAQSGGILTIFFLPPYSPDLNPDEWVWKNVKHDNLGRASVKSEDELAQFAEAALAKLKELAGQDQVILLRSRTEICQGITSLSSETNIPLRS